MTHNHPLGHLKISSGDINDILEFISKGISENKKTYCIPLNLTKYVMSKKDIKLQEVINSADLITPDGISIVWLSRRAGYQDVYRVPGIDLAERVLSESKIRGWRIFLLGTSSENLNKAVDNLKKRFNSPHIAGFHQGFFKEHEVEQIIELINKSNSDILFLGLGLPQKEYFIHDYFNKINVKFCLAVGGAFDVWAGAKQRTPKFIQIMGLEWLYRSFYDRSRFIYIAKYGLIYLKELVLIHKK